MGIIIRQSLKGSLVTYIGTAIGFISTLFVSTLFLQKQEIGLIAVLTEAAMLLASFSQLGVTNSAIRFFPYFRTQDNKHHSLFFYIMVLPLVGIALFFSIYIGFNYVIAGSFIEKSPLFVNYYYWVLPLAFFLIYIAVFESYANVLMRIVIPKMIREVGIRLCTLGSVLLYGFHIINLDQLIAFIVFSYGLAALINLFYVAKIGNCSLSHKLSEDIPPPLRREIIYYSLYFVVATLGGFIATKIDVFMIGSKLGLDDTGVFRIAYFMVVLLEIPSRSITAISRPLIAQAMKNNEISLVNSYFKRISVNQFLFASLIFVAIWINIKNIYHIIPNGVQYSQGLYVVLFLGLAKLIEMITNFGGIIINFSKYYKITLFFVLFLAILSVLSNLTFIPYFGIVGAALATFFSVTMFNVLSIAFVYRKFKIHPFSWGIARAVLLALSILGLNLLLPSLENFIVDMLYRTFVMGLIAVLGLYFLKISFEANKMIDQILDRLKILLK